MNHAGVKSSIDSSRMFNEPYAEIPSGALGTWGCPGSPGGPVHLSPSPSICLTDSFVSLCLPFFGPGCLPAWTPVTALWGGGVHLSPFVSLHLSPVASQPGCLARLSGWTGSFVSLCLPSFVWHGSLGFVSLDVWHGSPGGQIHLSPFVSLHLSPVSQPGLHSSLGGQFHLSPFVSLHLAFLVSQPGCLSRLPRRTDSLVSLGSPSFVSHLCGWIDFSLFVSLYLSPVVSQMPLWVDGFICLPLSPFCLPAWMPLWVDGFICLSLSPSLDVWHSRCGFLHFPRFCPFGGIWFAFGFGPGFGHSLGSWWVVFLVYRWLHPVCSFSASLSVAASLCPCSHLADESGALRCTASATRRLC